MTTAPDARLDTQDTTSLRSLRDRSWSEPVIDLEAAKSLGQAGYPYLAAHILAARGVRPETLDGFANARIKDLMPAPQFFLGMIEAADRLASSIVAGEKVGIWSDYDVDGATSAAVLGSFLRLCGHRNFTLRIPDRIHEGYGPNTPGLLSMKDEGCALVCILDAGTTAFEPLAAARAAGLDVLVIDHHAAEPDLPEAIAVVNPNRRDQAPGQGHLCAAGMTFLFAIATTGFLKRRSYFDGTDGRPGVLPDLWSLLDLVALGTVCDVVPLIGVNRAFVRRGLPLLTARQRPGIRALAEIAGIPSGNMITERECGWVLGPRINAGGRIGASDAGALLLLEEDDGRAVDRAAVLDRLNAERKELDKATTEAAIAQMSDRRPGVDRRLALAVVEEAHEGVVGISAARLREACDAPAIVLSRAHDGMLKGSARSVPGFDIGHAIIAARQAGLLIKGGGHGMAGGLTIDPARLEAFIAFMDARIAATDYAITGVVSQSDGRFRLSDIDVEGLRALEVLRPFGTANEEPRIILADVLLEAIMVVKETHLKLRVADGDVRMDAMMWGVAQLPLGERIRDCLGQRVDLYGVGSINSFRGTDSPQMIVSDVRLSR